MADGSISVQSEVQEGTSVWFSRADGANCRGSVPLQFAIKSYYSAVSARSTVTKRTPEHTHEPCCYDDHPSPISLRYGDPMLQGTFDCSSSAHFTRSTAGGITSLIPAHTRSVAALS
jgi:hypothetical protein